MNPPPMPFEVRANQRLSVKPDTTLEIINNNGQVELTGWDRPEVVIEVQSLANEKDKLSRVAPGLTPTRTGYKLDVIESYQPQDTYDYRRDGAGPGKIFLPVFTILTLRVPRNLTLKVQSHNANLTLSNLTGALDITTFNGTLDFTLVRNSDQRITAHTFNGKLVLPEPAFIWQGERRQEALARFGRGNVVVRLDSFNGTVRVK